MCSMFLSTVVIIFITLLNIIVYYLRKYREEGYDKRSHSSSSSSSSSVELCRRFSLAEIKSATRNFDEALVVGEGGFGKVYKGTLKNPESTVAIKRLNLGSKQGAPEFWTEIEMLSKFKHCHLVTLIGCCDDYEEMIIVYEYMSSGSLRDHLHKYGGISRAHSKQFNLSWLQRLKICIGAARGLDYLHTGTGIQQRVIHRDVKSSNILLDENWAAKISDFGLSKIGPANQDCTHVSTLNVKGTPGYLDPEYYMTRRVTRKSDVYSLGVVLLEVLCGRPALLKLDVEQHSLARWAKNCIKEGKLDQMIDSSLSGQILPTCLKEFTQVANQCLHSQPKKRPTMNEVVVKLEYALSLQERTDFSVLEGQITAGAYDKQENMDSSTEQESVNPKDGSKHQEKQSDGYKHLGGARRAKKVTFIKKVQSLFFMKTPILPAHIDEKPSRNSKTSIENSESSKMVGGDDREFPFPLGKETLHEDLKLFSYDELKIATSDFTPENLLGWDDYGWVYKGWLNKKTYSPSKSEMAIAVKTIDINFYAFPDPEMTVKSALKCLSGFSHPNLIELLGYNLDQQQLLLVYEYEFIKNGSLGSHLFEEGAKPLPWVTRLKILVGLARGLAFLNTIEMPGTYCELQMCNILLDGEFNSKLSHAGLEKYLLGASGDPLYYHPKAELPKTKHNPPLYNPFIVPSYPISRDHHAEKRYVIGFGFVLLETLLGVQCKRGDLSEWTMLFKRDISEILKLVDPRLGKEYPQEDAILLGILALRCLQDVEQPSMQEVLEELEQISTINDGTGQGNSIASAATT